MKRYKLTDARNACYLGKKDLADAVGADEISVGRWESGTQTPNDYHIGALCKFFDVKPVELNIDAEFNDKASTHCREDEILEMLKRYDRRQLLELLNRIPILAGIDLNVLFSTTVVAPEKLLNVCRAVVKECRNLLNENSYAIADILLSQCVSELESLATHSSKYQQEAASLVIEAKIIQITIATQKMDYERRVSLGSEVVHLGEMSGDRDLHVTAIGWHANTYVNCFSQPEVSIAILNDALPYLNDNAPLNTADIYMELARAHALDRKNLDKEAKEARGYIELAHIAMPENPEESPIFRLIDLGKAELDMREGKMYLILAKRFPSEKEYGQKAHDIFTTATDAKFLTVANRGATLIFRADAACATGNMHDYLDSLEEGVRIARQIGSDRGITHAVTTLQKAPRKWRNEQRYIELRKILTPSNRGS